MGDKPPSDLRSPRTSSQPSYEEAMSSPRLLFPKKITVHTYSGISHRDLLKLLRARKSKKYGFLEVAYEVDEVFTKAGQPCYNVRMEYTVKD